MKVRYTFPVESLTGAGSAGSGIVFSPWRGAYYARAYAKPSNPQTAEQVLIRNLYTQAAQGFSALTAAQKVNWEAFAANYPIEVNGKNVTLPAGNLYQRINVMRLIDGQALSATVPSVLPDFTATGVTEVNWQPGTTTMTPIITHSAAVTTGRLWKIELTRNIASDVVTIKDNDYRLMLGVRATSIIPVTASPQTITIATPITGTYTSGDFVGFRITPVSANYVPGTIFTEKHVIETH